MVHKNKGDNCLIPAATNYLQAHHDTDQSILINFTHHKKNVQMFLSSLAPFQIGGTILAKSMKNMMMFLWKSFICHLHCRHPLSSKKDVRAALLKSMSCTTT